MEIPKLPDTLRTEDEIIATWKGDISKPLVSVRCITYNHAPYIEDAIKGFLTQETDFPIEVWIHDDASTDGTRDIIEKYQKNYPRIIKTILQDVNQYSQGVKPGSFMDPLCLGEYYAVCEGDDYWYDAGKLARQVDVLQRHKDLDLCVHRALKYDYESEKSTTVGIYGNADGVIDLVDIIKKTHGHIPTASTLIRALAHKDLQKFVRSQPGLTVGDIYLHFFGARRGGAYYINATMSVYRLHVAGSFGSRYKKDVSLRYNHVESRVRSYVALDDLDISDEVSNSLRDSSADFILSYLKYPGNPYLKRLSIARKYGGLLEFKDKALIYPITFIPFALGAAHRAMRLLKKTG